MGARTQARRPAAARYWEIDVVRGLTVIAMVYFHFMWDLSFFRLSDVAIFSAPWQAFARGIGTTFTFLLGMSLAIRRERGGEGARPYLRRAAEIFGWGMLVTVATYLAVGPSFVVFGILHMQGVAFLLAFLFSRRPPLLSAAVGAAMMAAGFALNGVFVPHPWLIWLGVPQLGRDMVDYYPLLPWAGAALLGVAAGRVLYPGGERAVALPDVGGAPPLRALRFLGRHSLAIYLIHQPLILGALVALGLGSL